MSNTLSRSEREGKTPFNELPFYKQINWVHAVLLLGEPFISLYAILYVPLTRPTLIWAIIWYYATGIGITGGYHRLFAHRAYKAPFITRLYYALTGAGAVEGSILWWSKDHRVHHRYTDTMKDPYSAQRGLWWSHLGWMIFKKDRDLIGNAEVDDLEADPIIMWQHKNFLWIAIFMSLVFPTLVASLWGDAFGGYFYAGVIRMMFVHHATFCVNSLAHWLGESTFDDKHTPRDHIITALVTMGEGYHNFHHQFPQDYRNAIKFWQYDPTKWFITILSFFGLAYDLKVFPENEVRKGVINMKQKKLDDEKKTINWGTPLDELPLYSMEEFLNEVKVNSKQWIIVDDVIHDVTDFFDEHPGGRKYLKLGVGRDATEMFHGKVYDHSNAANNLLSQMRVGRLETPNKHHHD
ncbi:delta-9 desaturase [Conidiobolus coronatus NRRL 28638]|uniref:Acyl-CoA desaturase n=1 Tax=Conidiobolus coronatus (strain ATCC 28846 / CBS 209.66 / NRRL 28638) TaxID=796925 RepID=A0A137P3B4_CONC2|nr:delta-9 desaturase [Conidiobolus coronatus NRRL 28638]|eukprot:KXN69513.1 delta-9 desaturase [Conidiobolus coronatus NRRL 28638]